MTNIWHYMSYNIWQYITIVPLHMKEVELRGNLQRRDDENFFLKQGIIEEGLDIARRKEKWQVIRLRINFNINILFWSYITYKKLHIYFLISSFLFYKNFSFLSKIFKIFKIFWKFSKFFDTSKFSITWIHLKKL